MRDEMNTYRFEISNRREKGSLHMKFHFSCISKRPEIFMDMCRHSFSGSVHIIFYHPKWNFISVKMTDTKFIPALSFKCTFALTQHPTGLRLFIPFQINYLHMKISCHFKILFRSKWPIWNPYRFEFHFDSVPVNTSKELTEHQSEIFNRNKISYRFKFISPLMWTYSKICGESLKWIYEKVQLR